MVLFIYIGPADRQRPTDRPTEGSKEQRVPSRPTMPHLRYEPLALVAALAAGVAIIVLVIVEVTSGTTSALENNVADGTPQTTAIITDKRASEPEVAQPEPRAAPPPTAEEYAPRCGPGPVPDAAVRPTPPTPGFPVGVPPLPPPRGCPAGAAK